MISVSGRKIVLTNSIYSNIILSTDAKKSICIRNNRSVIYFKGNGNEKIFSGN